MPASSHIRRADRPQLPVNEPTQGWVPPEETIWQRYSANGESIISAMTSLLLHVALIGIILAGVWAIFDRSHEAPPAAEIIYGDPDGDDKPGGGEGNIKANGLQPGAPPRDSDINQALDLNAKRPDINTKDDVTVKSRQPRVDDDPLGDMLRRKYEGRPERVNLGKALEGVASAMQGPGVHGPSNNWSSAGNKPGDGIGNDKGVGRPKSRHLDRMRRWEIVFHTETSRHYLQQLESLGAILTVLNRQGQLMAVRDLKERPAQLESKDLAALDRIFWVDDRTDSVESVSRELGLTFTPEAIVAFFPQKFELDLVAKERAAQGLAEKDIEYTKFSITFRGGTPVIRVVEQRPQRVKK